MNKKAARYQVYTNPGITRERRHLGEYDSFSEARCAALDCVHGRGVPVIVIDTVDARFTRSFAPLILGVAVRRVTAVAS